MDKQLIDKIIDRVRSELYTEFSMDEEAPTNVIGDGEGAVKLRPTLMKFDGRKKNMKTFLKKLQNDRERREKRKILKKYPHLKQDK